MLFQDNIISSERLDEMLENKVNQTSFKSIRKRNDEHPIEAVGEKLRSMMPWIGENKLVD